VSRAKRKPTPLSPFARGVLLHVAAGRNPWGAVPQPDHGGGLERCLRSLVRRGYILADGVTLTDAGARLVQSWGAAIAPRPWGKPLSYFKPEGGKS